MRSNEKPERNEALFNDWKTKKFTSAELVAKYGVSTKTLYQIINRQRMLEVVPSLEYNEE